MTRTTVLYRWIAPLTFVSALCACGEESIQKPNDTLVPDTQSPDTDVDDSSSDTDAIEVKGKLILNEIAAVGVPEDWIELVNVGGATLDLTGYWLRDNDETHRYDFLAGTQLAPGEYMVLYRDESGSGQGFDFGLGSTDGVFIYDRDNQLIDKTSWLDGESPDNASWGRVPNVEGIFQTLFSPTPGQANQANPSEVCGNGIREGFEICDLNEFGPYSCLTLGWAGGELGCVETCKNLDFSGCIPREPALVINEVESDESDRIELFNGTTLAIDLSGYILRDDGNGTFILPEGTEIAPHSYLVFTKGTDHSFGLGDVDGVTLLTPEGEVIDAISWQRGEAIPSFCRLPNGVGGFRICDAQTFGSENLE